MVPDGAALEPAVFTDLGGAFERARRARPEQFHEFACSIAGYPVRVRVVGDTLARLTHRPLGHLVSDRAAGASPRLTVDLWDESVTGVACPHDGDDPYGAHVPMPMGGVLSLSDWQPIARYAIPGSTTWVDRRAGRVIGWRADGESSTMAEATRPLPVVLPLWCLDRDIHVIHAGLVAHDGRGVLVVGPSGVGKSTVTLACARAGLDFLGDDTVGLERTGDGMFVGHSLFSSVRLDPDHLARFPDMMPHAIASVRADEPKSLLHLWDLMPERLARSVPIVAMILPAVTGGGPTHVQPASRRDVLRHLARGVLWFMEPNLNLASLKRMTAFFTAVPSYRLELGTDIDAIADHVRAVLCRAGTPESG